MLIKLELKRQLIHILLGLFLVFFLKINLINATTILFIFIVGLTLSFFSRRFHIPLVYDFLKIFERKADLEKFPGKGAVSYVFGAYIAVLIFPKDIAMASIMILALGDSVSRLVGPYGYLKHPFTNVKFFEGAIAGAIAGFLGALYFVPWLQALIASIVAMLIEGIDLKIKGFKIDDNLLIPIVAGIVMISIMALGQNFY